MKPKGLSGKGRIEEAEAKTIFNQVNEGRWTFEQAAANFVLSVRRLEIRLSELGYKRRRKSYDVIEQIS